LSTKKSRNEKAKREDDVYRTQPNYPKKRLMFSLPVPPSVNHMYVQTRRGTKSLTANAKNYIRDAKALILAAIEDNNWMMQDTEVWFYVDVVVYMPDRRIRDSNNMSKLLLDVMQGLIFENDYYALLRFQSVEYNPDNPRLDICISPQLKKHRIRAFKMTQDIKYS